MSRAIEEAPINRPLASLMEKSRGDIQYGSCLGEPPGLKAFQGCPLRMNISIRISACLSGGNKKDKPFPMARSVTYAEVACGQAGASASI
jgi:hypothetical protein